VRPPIRFATPGSAAGSYAITRHTRPEQSNPPCAWEPSGPPAAVSHVPPHTYGSPISWIARSIASWRAPVVCGSAAIFATTARARSMSTPPSTTAVVKAASARLAVSVSARSSASWPIGWL
jgi:hypothetical protein